MNNVCCIHIDDHIDSIRASAIREELMRMPHVVNVENPQQSPQNMTVEFERHFNVPMDMMLRLEKRHLHPDILVC